MITAVLVRLLARFSDLLAKFEKILSKLPCLLATKSSLLATEPTLLATNTKTSRETGITRHAADHLHLEILALKYINNLLHTEIPHVLMNYLSCSRYALPLDTDCNMIRGKDMTLRG